MRRPYASMEDVFRGSPELRPFLLSDVHLTGTTLGAGAYGSVEEVAIPGAICAAKKIHEVFLDRSKIPDDEILRATTKFVSECQLMSILRHPHIVQFLGVCFFPGSRLPALVMERLLTSLHDLLDPETDPPPSPDAPKPFFPLSLKCSILHDVASGLTYLHERSPPVIHRDLSARNVLLNSGMVAKIADMGVARIVPRMRAAATMTTAPGAGIYMPPEALEIKSEEDEEQSSNQTFPCNLLAPNYRNERRQLVGRTELERRGKYMSMIYSQLREKHPLLQMIEGCVDFPEDRPSIREVLSLLEQARAEDRDRQMDMNKLELMRALHTQPRNQSLERDLWHEVSELRQQLQSNEREKQTVTQQLSRAVDGEWQLIQQMRQQETEKDELVQAKDRELAWAQQQLREKEEQLRSIGEDFKRPLRSRAKEPVVLRTEQSATHGHMAATPLPHPKPRMLRIGCSDKKASPREMERGSATTDLQFAYFTPHSYQSVYRYELRTGTWTPLRPCPYNDSALVMVNGELTAVGGVDESLRRTNKLLTLRQKKWVEALPAMHTVRSSSAVVSSSDGGYVIVIGGYDGRNWTTTVELFRVRTRRWNELTNLPHPLSYPSATICGNQLHVIGNNDKGHSCSLNALPLGDKPLPARSSLISWTPLPRLPCESSTAATLSEQLVIIGGRRSYWESNNTIHQLVDGQWVLYVDR